MQRSYRIALAAACAPASAQDRASAGTRCGLNPPPPIDIGDVRMRARRLRVDDLRIER